jgi:hypothetical protein
MIALPKDVADWLTGVFATCNAAASSKLTLVPNGHEPWLDFAVIENLQRVSVPYRFKSDWLVSLDTHWLGSAPMWHKWEIADIGIVVMFRTGGKLVRSKIALLQSKRLYADKRKPETDQEKKEYYWKGFGRLYQTDEQFAEMTTPKLFEFTGESEYGALKKGDDQWKAVAQYEEKKQIPVYYLFYNPLRVPSTVSVPHRGEGEKLDPNDTGCRVVPYRTVRGLMEKDADGQSPTFGQLLKDLPAPFDGKDHQAGWRLEHFVVDLLLQCKTGRITDIRDDEGLFQVFYRRSGPIQAAIALTIDAPAGFDWAVEPG